MADRISRSAIAMAWFVRACSLFVLILWVLALRLRGWSIDLRSFGSLTGLIGAAMLCLSSFTLVTTGKAKTIFAIGTLILAMGVIALSLPGIWLPRP